MRLAKLLTILFFVGSQAVGQNLDSLNHVASQKDTSAVKANNLLYNHYINSDPKKALDYTLKALDLALKLNYKKGIAASYNNIGVFYKNHGVIDKAMNYHLQSLQLNKEINNTKGIAYSLNNIGTIYSLKGRPKEALNYFLQSYWLLDSLKDEKNMVGALNNLGNTYLAMGEDYRAIGFYKKALKIYDKIDHSEFDPYANIGNAYFKREEYKRAQQYYELSMETSNERKDVLGQAYALHNLSAISSKLGNKKEALRQELDALALAQSMINKPLLKDIHLALAKLYYEAGDLENAYDNRVLYDAYKDDIINEASNKKLSELELTFQMLEKEKQLAILKKENEVNKLKVSNTKTYVIITIMGVIILLGGLLIIISLKRGNKLSLLDPRWKVHR
ncbi:MAG: tetratricopeptide repeat protein [Cyclobacteriaceae bacterium]|nr:tetratricopeptide repeat protein [Cyclobacteriaceae bacterium]